MTETVTIDRPSVARPLSRPRPRKPATVSASALALHLDCSRTYIGKLEAEGVIQRQGDGFPLDQSRVAYLRPWRGIAADVTAYTKRKAACVATSGPSLGRKRPRRAAIAWGCYRTP